MALWGNLLNNLNQSQMPQSGLIQSIMQQGSQNEEQSKNNIMSLGSILPAASQISQAISPTTSATSTTGTGTMPTLTLPSTGTGGSQSQQGTQQGQGTQGTTTGTTSTTGTGTGTGGSPAPAPATVTPNASGPLLNTLGYDSSGNYVTPSTDPMQASGTQTYTSPANATGVNFGGIGAAPLPPGAISVGGGGGGVAGSPGAAANAGNAGAETGSGDTFETGSGTEYSSPISFTDTGGSDFTEG